jgi:hypothetical protein
VEGGMTGDIREKLFNSETAETIRMESSISDFLSRMKWEVVPSYYYTDLSTEKLREIDVYALRTFHVPRLKKFIGAPLVNVHLICECKTLSGSNVIVVPSRTKQNFKRVLKFWIGYNDNIRQISSLIYKAFQIGNVSSKKEIYDFLLNKAYPHEEQFVSSPIGAAVNISLPKVDVECNIFRETKSGAELKEGESSVWRTTQSLFSSTDAIFKSEKERFHNNFEDSNLEVDNVAEVASWAAFMAFENLLRQSYFHPFLVTKAKIWTLEENGVVPVESARIFVSGLFRNDEYLNNRYIDIVQYEHASRYLENMVSVIQREANLSLKKLANYVESSGWLEENGRDDFKALITNGSQIGIDD